jgi:uncharacterized protein YaaQ
MKMVILIVKNQDADEITQALTSEKYRITRVASTGGFLRSGVVTFLICATNGWNWRSISSARS